MSNDHHPVTAVAPSSAVVVPRPGSARSAVTKEQTRPRSRTGSFLGKILKTSSHYGDLLYHHELMSQFTHNLQDYEIVQPIGVMEDISQAYVAKHIVSDKQCVLKLTDLEMSQELELLTEAIDIVRNSKLCNCEYLLKYYTAFTEGTWLWSVLEPVRAGSVKNLLSDVFSSGLPGESSTATIIRDVLRATHYLHSQGYIHANIRAENIMLDTTGEVKLGGLHQMISKYQNGRRRTTVFDFVGDAEWMAPEVISQATTFNEKIDIYGVGITTIECLYGKTPFDEWEPPKILHAKLSYEIPNPPESTTRIQSKNVTEFIANCTRTNPDLRPPAEQLLSDPFIKTAKSHHHLAGRILGKYSHAKSGVYDEFDMVSPVPSMTRVQVATPAPNDDSYFPKAEEGEFGDAGSDAWRSITQSIEEVDGS